MNLKQFLKEFWTDIPKWKKALFSIGAAAIAALAGFAAVLTDLETVTEKPKKIAANIGLEAPSRVPIVVRLSAMDNDAAIELVGARDDTEMALQRYAFIDGVYCLDDGAVQNCKIKKNSSQNGYSIVRYFGENSFIGAFAPAIPIFDIAAVRPDERDILLTRQSVEFEKIEDDETPYVEILGVESSPGSVELISHSSEELVSIDLDFRIDDIVASSYVKQWLKQKKRETASGPFPKKLHVTSGSLFGKPFDGTGDYSTQNVELKKAIIEKYPGLEFYENALQGRDNIVQPWVPAAKDRGEFYDTESVLLNRVAMVVGIMTVTSRKGHTYQSKFTVPVTVATEAGYGAGAVNVDTNNVYVISGKVRKGVVGGDVVLSLNDDSPTIRSNVAIFFERSGLYKLRFKYSSSEEADFMASDWIVIQAFASPIFVSNYYGFPANTDPSGE